MSGIRWGFWSRLNPGKDSAADANDPEPCAADVEGERVFVKFGYSHRRRSEDRMYGMGTDIAVEPISARACVAHF